MRKYRDKQIEEMRSKGWHTPSSVAQRIQSNVSTVYRWYYAGKVKGLKVGSAIYISEDSLEEHLSTEGYAELGL